MPAEEIAIGNSLINVAKDESGNIIKATGKSIRFIYDLNLCKTDFNTGYFGKKSGSNLSIEQLQEYYNLYDKMQIDDATITWLNSENFKGNFF